MEYKKSGLFSMAKAGDIGAFEKLIRPYEKKIYAIALKNSGNPRAASELAQEVFVKAYKSMGSIENERMFSLCIYNAARDVFAVNRVNNPLERAVAGKIC
jgi:RNA polymerase sigma-70 factor (ECF subfamily)